MKTFKTLFLAVALIASYTLTAQVVVTSDGSSADGSAMLEVKSTDKGFLPPRMTTTQRDAILSPAKGLVVWCTNCGSTGELQVYNGYAWTNMIGGPATQILAVGDYYQGGVVAYIFTSDDDGYVEGETHGLIAATSDQGTYVEWGCYLTLIDGAYGTAIGTGAQNTLDILAGCSTDGIAAKLCADYSNDGYDDWYLPSKDELHKLYLNRATIGGFQSYNYWSSTQYNADYAYDLHFSSSNPDFHLKGNEYHVRAVRTF